MAEPSREPDLDVELYSQARLLSSVRAMAHQFAHRIGFGDMQCHQIGLAIDEALCNIINHGYDKRPDGRIRISFWCEKSDPDVLRVVIEDRARQVDPDTIQSRDLDDIRPGGLGVFIMREIMDEVTYEHRAGGGMRLVMVKQVTSEPETAACPPGPGARPEPTHPHHHPRQHEEQS